MDIKSLELLVRTWANEQSLPSAGVTVTVSIVCAGDGLSTQATIESTDNNILLMDFLSEENFEAAGVPAKINLIRIRNVLRNTAGDTYNDFPDIRYCTVDEFVNRVTERSLLMQPNFSRKSLTCLNQVLKHHGYPQFRP